MSRLISQLWKPIKCVSKIRHRSDTAPYTYIMICSPIEIFSLEVKRSFVGTIAATNTKFPKQRNQNAIEAFLKKP